MKFKRRSQFSSKTLVTYAVQLMLLYLMFAIHILYSVSLGILQTMGNDNAKTNVINRSSRNVRAFISQEKLDIEAFITKYNGQSVNTLLPHSAIKKFCFRPDVPSYRILISENGELPWEKNQYISLFIEDEDDKEICIKHVCLCMALPYVASILIYDI